MPLTKKGSLIMKSMKSDYGSKKGKQVFYASKNKGVISGVDKGFYGHMNPTRPNNPFTVMKTWKGVPHG